MPGSDDRRDSQIAAMQPQASPGTLKAVLCDHGLPQHTLFGCIAHDLSGPLTYVQWDADALARLIEMLRQAVDQSPNSADFDALCAANPKLGRAYREVPTLMEHIKGGLKRLQQLSADLALLAEDDRAPETFDLRDAVTQALRLIRPFVTRRLIVEYVPGDTPQLVHGQRGDLVQALMSLGLNAAQASTEGPAEGRLQLAFDSTRQQVGLRLKDNGSGIASGDPESLFSPFATQHPGRAGLGLAVVKQVVEDHNGTVCLTPRPAGTEVTIRLPRQQH